MKAVFVTIDCLCQVQGSATESGPGTSPAQATIDAMGGLGGLKILTVVLDAGARASDVGAGTQRMDLSTCLDGLRQEGLKIDALLRCPHSPGDSCTCWGPQPGFLYAASAQLDLRLNECYVLCCEPADVALAQQVGCRPILILGARTIADLYEGHSPDSHDFPIARSLTDAVGYVLSEEEASRDWQQPRLTQAVLQTEELAQVSTGSDQMPVLELFTPLPVTQPWMMQLAQSNRRMAKFLVVLVLGGIWVSLGIAYILTHLYRVQHFPEFVWYLTLQFVPRPLRGALFIGSGAVLVALSLRAFSQLAKNSRLMR